MGVFLRMNQEFTLPRGPRPLSAFLLRAVLPVVALLLLVGAAYHEAPKNTYHLDDGMNIFDNPWVRVTELTVDNLIDAARFATQYQRPLPSVTFAFDFWRGRGHPGYFQWTNMIIHGLAAVCLFALLVLILRRVGHRTDAGLAAAFFAAALWASHPIQVQAVTYVSQRMASMVALFVMLTLIFYLLGRTARTSSWRIAFYLLATVAFLLGLATKQNAVIVPGLLLLVEYGVLRHGRQLVRSKLDVALLCLPPVVLALVTLDFATGAGPLAAYSLPFYDKRDFTLAERLMTQPRVIGFHFGQILWPLPGRFSLEHDFTLSKGLLTPPSTILAFAGVALWCAAGLWALFRARWRVVGFFLLWMPASLAIESTFHPLEMVFEHRMYLPLAGLAGLMALAAAWCLERSWRLRLGTAAVLGLIVVLLSVSTMLRVPVWRTGLSLAENSLKHAPNSGRAWAGYGANLLAEERGEEAETALRKALELDPDEDLALEVLAMRLLDTGDLDGAEQMLERRARIGLLDHHVMNTFGELRLQQGNAPEAIYYFSHAVEWDKTHPVYRWNLALAHEAAGECKQAREQWQAYLHLEAIEHEINEVRKHLEEIHETEGGKCFGVPE